MNGRNSVKAAELSHSLEELANARRRLEELRAAYAIVESSRFALLRRAYHSLTAALGLRKIEPPLVVPEPSPISPARAAFGPERRHLDIASAKPNAIARRCSRRC